MTDCYCDYDPPKFITIKKPRARKVHKCTECGGPIMPGEHYESVSGKWDDFDGLRTFAICEQCHDIRQWVTNNLPCFCWAYGSMLDDANEATREVRREPEAAGVRFGFLRRRILARRFRQQQQRKTAA